MAKTLPTFHIERQYAASLLEPIGGTLDELVARLDQYRERLPLSDLDREAIGAAVEAIRSAADTVRTQLASRREAGFK